MNDHLQQVLRNTQLSYQDADLAAALASLSQLVSGKNTYPGEVDLPTYSIEVLDKHKYEIPPAEIVSQVLREVEDIYDTVVGLFYPIRAYKDAVALCKDLYFNIEDVPVSRLIVTFGTMYYIFEFYQYSLSADDPRHAQYAHYTTSFARNMMDLLGHLNLLMPPSDDNVEALMLTVSRLRRIAECDRFANAMLFLGLLFDRSIQALAVFYACVQGSQPLFCSGVPPR